MMLPERLAAAVESYEADANTFPWQRIEDKSRTLFSIFRNRITVAADGAAADRL